MQDLSRTDWRERIKSGKSLLPENLKLDLSEALAAERTFNALKLPDVAGNPRLADASGQWFRDIVRALFGSYDPETGERSIRELFCVVPKKSSKTTYSAALMLTALLQNRRPRAEFLFVAPSIKIAELAYNQARGMIEIDPFLSKRIHCKDYTRLVTDRKTGATLQVKTFDPAIVTGSRGSGILLDELHVVAETNDADRVIGQLRGGLISQPEGFLVFITTQGERAPAGVFRSELQKARAIRDGRLQGRMLPVIYEFPEDIDWKDPANWHMVSPNLGRPVTIETLKDGWRDAEFQGEEELRRWASQHLNVEVGVRLMSDMWSGAGFWEGNADTSITLDALTERCDCVTVGIDGGGLDDLFGFSVIGRERGTGNWLAWSRAWCHGSTLEKRKDVAGALRGFADDGTLTIVPRVGDDLTAVADIIERLDRSGLLPETNAIGVDPAGIGEVVEAIVARGIAQDRIVGIPQGWKLTGAIKTVERKLAGGELHHDGSALMNWCVGNAKVEPRGNGIIITKQQAGKAKIDPLMALFDAAALMALNPSAGPSVYEAVAALKEAAKKPKAPQEAEKARVERFFNEKGAEWAE